MKRIGRPPTPLRERFASKYIPEPNSGCWLWTGALFLTGYPQISPDWKKPNAYGHRVSYEIHKGPIPAGMLVCHKCDVRSCVNPDHLYLGTHADNNRDMHIRGRYVKAYTHRKAS